MDGLVNEAKVGEPRAKYTRSVERGLHDAPTVLNNVETWALVPGIIKDGAAAFASIGTKRSKGTKAFSLTGQVQRTGLVEVPMGTTLRQRITNASLCESRSGPSRTAASRFLPHRARLVNA
ncbi:MAG: hypothetical protein MUF54_21020, partial [Polyangiaceae bacterium]|nr:hypothetical protein [Polyangiaceae bacterium]